MAAAPAPVSVPWLWLCRAAILVALSASAALFLQYLNPAGGAFCNLSSGCEAVRRSSYVFIAKLAGDSEALKSVIGHPFLSIPMVGLVGFATLLTVSVFSPRGPWTLRLSGLGAIVAFGLMFAQAFVVHAFCWLCLVVDVSAVMAFVFASMDSRADPAASREPLPRWAFGALATVALLIPVGWSRWKPLPRVPQEILALYEPGKINVVEFADFECPFCRMFHPTLRKVVEKYPGRVHFVRRHVPLPGHPEAAPAAAAAICAEAQGKGESFAEKLMVGELGPDALRSTALGTGVDLAAWDRCMNSTVPGERILADVKLIEAAGMLGLPTTYVGATRLLGAQPEAAVDEAFALAASGHPPFSIPGPFYAGLALAAISAVVWLGRNARGSLEHERAGS